MHVSSYPFVRTLARRVTVPNSPTKDDWVIPTCKLTGFLLGSESFITLKRV